MEPFIYVIDIDGTLIGDISHQVAEWEIIMKYDPKKLKAFKSHLIHQLQHGLLRPGIADCITTLKNNNELSEFFLYTASDDKWAQFLVPCMEVACGIKFGRPIFSRKHCLCVDRSMKKSLLKISNMVHTKLKPRYMHMFKKPSHVFDHMLLIDNNKVLVEREARKAIICPSYEYVLPCDILRLIDADILESNALGICKILAKYELMDEKVVARHTHAYTLLAAYYDAYASLLRQMVRVSAMQERQKRDKFWPNLANALVALQQKRVTKDAMLKYINSKLRANTGLS